MDRARLLAASLLLGLLPACGEDLAEPPEPAPAQPEASAGGPASEPPAASPAPEEAEFKVPDVWCGTDMVGGGGMSTPRNLWHEVESGLWRRVFRKRMADGRWVVVIEWGVDRAGKFVTWQEEVDSGRRPLWGHPPIPDRPRERPPR